MQEELDLVRQFHVKFDQPTRTAPSLIPNDRSVHRHRMMVEEVAEYKQAVDDCNLPGIAKDLAPAIFAEVARSNLSKDWHEYKMIKGAGYFTADIEQILKNKYTTTHS